MCCTEMQCLAAEWMHTCILQDGSTQADQLANKAAGENAKARQSDHDVSELYIYNLSRTSSGCDAPYKPIQQKAQHQKQKTFVTFTLT